MSRSVACADLFFFIASLLYRVMCCLFSFKVCGTDEEFDLRDRYCATEGIRKWSRVKL